MHLLGNTSIVHQYADISELCLDIIKDCINVFVSRHVAALGDQTTTSTHQLSVESLHTNREIIRITIYNSCFNNI